jgi:predicted DNA-binding protein
MATTKERLLITLAPDMAKELRQRAKREASPRATVAARLLREAMDNISDDEDRALAELAERRRKTTKRWLSPEEFWGLPPRARRRTA